MNQLDTIRRKIENDPFARSLGISIEELEPGRSKVSLTVTEEMMNFHNTAHGGLIFSLADAAFGAASNSRGQTAVGMNVNINYLKPCFPGDHLIATAEEVSQGGRTALYDIVVTRPSNGEIIARCQGLVYRTKEHFVDIEKS